MKSVKVTVPPNLVVAGFKITQGADGWELECRACRQRWGFPLGKTPGVGVKLKLLDHQRSHETRRGAR